MTKLSLNMVTIKMKLTTPKLTVKLNRRQNAIVEKNVGYTFM